MEDVWFLLTDLSSGVGKSVVARPGTLYPARHEFLFMLREAKLRERVAPDFVWQGWDERVIRREGLRQKNYGCF